jgi:hypothetical protein
LVLLGFCCLSGSVLAAEEAAGTHEAPFPPPLSEYGDRTMTNAVGKLMVMDVLKNRVEKEPFNIVATLLFLAAVIHTFLTHKFRHMAHVIEDRHKAKHEEEPGQTPVNKTARLLHFLGEIEAVFGIWVIPLCIWMMIEKGPEATIGYLSYRVHYTEPIFVVIIMAISATRPVLQLAETIMRKIAGFGGGTVVAWWFSIMTLGPLLGSFITEPAAMTISASLLVRQFYQLKPPPRLAYATLGLLFVNVSVGGTLTHFAAPPVLMVAGKWGWDTPFMISHFGWITVSGILICNILYFLAFKKYFANLQGSLDALGHHDAGPKSRVPFWVTTVHLLFMGAAVLWAHYPVLLVGSFLFFLAFFEITEDYQGTFQLRSPILVGFFLAGLVIHGGLQQWWIGPVLGSLSEIPLRFGAIVLTAFNDNAAITYLATLVPDLAEHMKYAVVEGAVIGGGLTVIANAPNPAGQSILNDHFEDGISPLGLLLGAIVPTLIFAALFTLLG